MHTLGCMPLYSLCTVEFSAVTDYKLPRHSYYSACIHSHAVILVREVLVTRSGPSEAIPLIEEDTAGISIPREVFSGLSGGQNVRVASVLYRNMTGFLPEYLTEDDSRSVNTHNT